MTTNRPPIQDLQHSLDEALDLLRDYSQASELPAGPHEPLPSLLAQCEALCAEFPDSPPIRSIHHFAFTGGSLICKCIASMPNVTLLSEIDPLSRMQIAAKEPPKFIPTDLLYGARIALRPIDDAAAASVFEAAVQRLHQTLCDTGRYMVLRDHAHSQFCTDTAPPDRPTQRNLLTRIGPVLSVVTVRHPLDSYLSLILNHWRTVTPFTPFTLEEYARRYIAFLEQHAGLALYRYEDFVAAPDDVLCQICADLDLPFTEDYEELIGIVPMSGDSGRSSATIAARPRRAVSPEIIQEIADSPTYADLCLRLEYAPNPVTSESTD